MDGSTLAWLIFGCAVVFAWMVVGVIRAWRGVDDSDIEEPWQSAPPEVWQAYYAACAARGTVVSRDMPPIVPTDRAPTDIAQPPSHIDRGGPGARGGSTT